MNNNFIKAILKTLALFGWGIFVAWVISQIGGLYNTEMFLISVLTCVVTMLSIDYYKNKKD